MSSDLELTAPDWYKRSREASSQFSHYSLTRRQTGWLHLPYFIWHCEQDFICKAGNLPKLHQTLGLPTASHHGTRIFEINVVTCGATKGIHWTQKGDSLWVKKPERPSTGLDTSEEEWVLVYDTWTLCRLEDKAAIRDELQATCTTETIQQLFKLVSSTTINSTTEEYLLQQVRLVVVKWLHKDVHRQRFHYMVQNEGESIIHFYQNYVAKLNFANLISDIQMNKLAGSKWIIQKTWSPDRW